MALLQIKLFKKKEFKVNKAVHRIEEPFLPKLKIQGIDENNINISSTNDIDLQQTRANYHDNNVVVIGDEDQDGPIVQMNSSNTEANGFNTGNVLVECGNFTNEHKPMKINLLDTYECITIYEVNF